MIMKSACQHVILADTPSPFAGRTRLREFIEKYKDEPSLADKVREWLIALPIEETSSPAKPSFWTTP